MGCAVRWNGGGRNTGAVLYKRGERRNRCYHVQIIKPLYIKHANINGIQVKTYYFLAQAIGASQGIQDPDQLIEEKAWKSLADILKLNHMYPEDVDLLRFLIGM